ncbi:transcription termination factor NusA [Candidatus Amesbacteria bacterium RIFCSPLOWO2_02_FULL_48_11]|uniref:Transcription termination/antitermination protein NusA n=5 Tax=Candidatus Amesiibacteriota TaxID=1752730 RepID=A0A1F4Z9I4_9BACT|nr:MAG: Transcription termination factor NusA [Candidatus Amesbacteria bacterium GW2011_GWA2_47_11]KKU94872.1 MAG: Transcription termination factor NusA [Candidatus Amesbacteria bacterium GW2011_GWC1_48_10]KKW01060.1 MAG: Transcription termination factor NusA [Candidatus Amesbacteria bacterium GW2011_GWA1_48_9]OGC89638.1 MAG: transcription termination factor NusA [Candidatus Amesbacteria bacterium RBG_19FT_COMBO_48_16]OGC96962.1 MAG: transcription termination factor NusA [Candidatus Amesbacteri
MPQKPVARTEFAQAVTQIARERNLDPDIVLDAIKQAKLAAFKKDHPESYREDCLYEVELDPGTGQARIFETPGEIYQEDEQTRVRVQKGATPVDVTPPGFGRIAAQTAKQVIYQKIREAEKSVVVAEYEKRLGTLVNGMIIRFVGSDIIVDIGKAEAVMSPSEQVHSEDYRLNQRLTFYLHSIRDSLRGKEVVVSRSDSGLIRELFRREVPEVASGAVEIKAIARDPGSRSKVAVYSHQSGVDPVGSCVGQKGVRVQAVIGELNGEKLDIVQFSEDLDKYISAALSPASGLTVKVNSKSQTALVTAPADQLPLAIGRDGQNAKLAGKLTGIHIDIIGEKGTSEQKEEISDQDDKPQTSNSNSQ